MNFPMTKFMGMNVLESPLATRREIRRVRGGYMKRWLIRAEVTVPCVIHIGLSNTIYVHPDLMAQLEKEGYVERRGNPAWD